MNKSTKCQILLCGTQYGQSYLPAIFESNDLELAAILANGSDRSLKISEQCGVALFAEAQHINEPIDLACVAIGGNTGASIAATLLKKGIPVLLEHPVSTENIHLVLAAAEQNRTFCHINSHFSEIQPVAHFIALCHKLTTKSTPSIVNISCNSRTLFSTLDIVMRCFGECTLGDVQSTSFNVSDSHLNCTLSLNKIPCTLVYQKWRSKNDNSKDSPLGHQITITYPEGVLCLNGTFGPCLWFPLLAGDVPQDIPIYSDVNNSNPFTLEDMYHWRSVANQKAMHELNETHQHRKPIHFYQKKSYLSHLCQTWSHLYSQLGTVNAEPTIQRINKEYWTCNSILSNQLRKNNN